MTYRSDFVLVIRRLRPEGAPAGLFDTTSPMAPPKVISSVASHWGDVEKKLGAV